MGYNKVIYGNKTLIDLTADTITAADLTKGVTAHDKAGDAIIGTSTKDSDTTDATVAVAEILNGKTAYARGTKLTGTMVNNGAYNGAITSASQNLTIPIGYHDGSGYVSIDSAEKAKIIAANIREGISILGVTGTMSGSEDVKAQSKTVVPSTTEQTVSPDEGFNYLSSVTVAKIPYSESDNSAGGTTVTIAG